MDTLRELFEDQIKDIYSAEQQLVKALPKMAEKASSKLLRKGFQEHLKQTEKQVSRLEQLASKLDFKLEGKRCKAMEGLVAEGKEVIDEEGDDSVLDVALIAAAQRVEHYEIAAYGTVIAMADQLGLSDASELLEETLNEEKETDERLTEICTSEVFASLPQEEDEEEEQAKSPRSSKKPAERSRPPKNM